MSRRALRQEEVATVSGFVAKPVEIDGHACTIAHHGPTGNPDIADRSAIRSPDELTNGVGTAGNELRPAGGVNDKVGLLADFDRTDQVTLADRPGSADGGQGESIVRAGREGIFGAIASETDEERCRSQDVNRVAGVLGVATKGQTSAAPQQFVVTIGADESLGQPQVGPRTRSHRRVVGQHRFHFVVVEMHPVGDQHMRSEHAELIQVNERPTPGAGSTPSFAAR